MRILVPVCKLAIFFLMTAHWSIAKASESRNEKTVYFNAWAGNEKINKYIQNESEIFFKATGIRVVHVKVSDYQPAIKKIQAEKSAGNVKDGSVDVLWINGENFMALKSQNLLFGPIQPKIKNFKNVDEKDPTFKFDFNIPVEGYEIPWGKAQFVFIWDKAQTPKPPESAIELLDFAKANPGKISYVKPPQFHGTTFLKQILLDLSPDIKTLQKPCESVNEIEISKPLWNFLNLLHPYLWRKAETFPLSVEKMNQMLLDKELLMSMSFNPQESESLVRNKEIPAGSISKTFIKGGIGNVHFLSIPFNSKNKEGALLWINHLLSIEAQANKSDVSQWGDPTVLNLARLKTADRLRFPESVLKGPLLSEPHACWTNYLQGEWLKRYGSGVR